MLRSVLANHSHASRTIASSSSKSIACLHTTAPVCVASEGRRQNRTARQRQQGSRKEIGVGQGRPHVVLGTRPGDEAKWTNCELAKIIITEAQVRAAPLPSLNLRDPVTPPQFANFGIGEKEKDLLFEVLPELSEEANTMVLGPSTNEGDTMSLQAMQEKYRSHVFSALVDLRNANADGIAFENRKRIIAAFSRPGKPNDSGLPEVQAAILTMRIRNVWDHLSKNRKDVIARRNLRQLVHQRAKILKYLKRIDRDRYDAVLGRLGLEAQSVEGELVV
ncbi:mitochondrial ribosomal protein S15 [Cristinia sonorae]|uniref:Mitochondrial ribosomal protein S15 n=1 Tax=Cristinia sonorae TaxID=1940300 RepID=A0A8K0XMU9_9AGAR|nr:mitochondrial ribosomal protein S15 [Cristinia sonorae]